MLFSQFVIGVGWAEILKRTGLAIYEEDCLGWAAELAYFWFLALFPALLFLVALAAYIPLAHLIDSASVTLSRVAPADVLAIVNAQLGPVARGRPHGWLLTFSLLAAVWSSSSGMTAIIDTLNHAYLVKERRPWWRVRVLAIGLTISLAVFALISLGFVMLGPMLADAVRLRVGPGFAWVWAGARWLIVFVLLVTPLGWIYYLAPDARRPWIWITPGSIAAALLWMLISAGFKWYAVHFGNYQQTYGAIGGVMVTLVWFYLCGLAILIGAQLNATIEHAAAKRSSP